MKLQTCLLFIIALPVIVILSIFIGIPFFIFSFGFISSLISGIGEIALLLGGIFAAVTIIGIINYVITRRDHKVFDEKLQAQHKEDIARFEALSTPEEYVAYYEEKLQAQREHLQRAKANGLRVGHDPYIRHQYKEIMDTKRTITRYKNMSDL